MGCKNNLADASCGQQTTVEGKMHSGNKLGPVREEKNNGINRIFNFCINIKKWFVNAVQISSGGQTVEANFRSLHIPPKRCRGIRCSRGPDFAGSDQPCRPISVRITVGFKLLTRICKVNQKWKFQRKIWWKDKTTRNWVCIARRRFHLERTINQSINQTINQSSEQSIKLSINQSSSQSINQSCSKSISQ